MRRVPCVFGGGTALSYSTALGMLGRLQLEDGTLCCHTRMSAGLGPDHTCQKQSLGRLWRELELPVNVPCQRVAWAIGSKRYDTGLHAQCCILCSLLTGPLDGSIWRILVSTKPVENRDLRCLGLWLRSGMYQIPSDGCSALVSGSEGVGPGMPSEN